MNEWVVAALYQFVRLSNHRDLQAPLYAVCKAGSIRGTLLLAEEGINGTIAGPSAGIDAVLEFLRSQPGLSELQAKRSIAYDAPFHRLKVRVKKEIVTMGVLRVDPAVCAGEPVDPLDWNDLIDDPSVLILDTRNDYEVRVGTFERALDPKLRTFREFPAWAATNLDPARDKTIAMFCTGGIRCEKASSYLRDAGFERVLQLKGGILDYLARVPAECSRFRGECFVFDYRVAVACAHVGGGPTNDHGARSIG